MVSRAGLQSPPTAMSHPSARRGDALPRQQAVDAVKQANQDVTRAAQAVQQASTETAVKSALHDAAKALNAARRAGGGSEAKAALRVLERQVDQLRRKAIEKQQDIAGREYYEREHQAGPTAVAHDHLSPLGLGVVPRVINAEAGRKGAWNPDLKASSPNAAVVVDNRAIYETDALGRTVRAVTVLDQLAADTDRSGSQQRAAGGPDRLTTDDGGHIFATLFGGLGEDINIQAMDLSINRGAYQELESLWAQQVERGGEVHVEVMFHFSGESRRPDQFEVAFDFGDGRTTAIPFYQ
jgi:ribosomal protein S20